jgi:hypothetical protein
MNGDEHAQTLEDAKVDGAIPNAFLKHGWELHRGSDERKHRSDNQSASIDPGTRNEIPGPVPGVSVSKLQTPRLNPPVEWMRFCYGCNTEAMFVADRVCASGLVGRCSHCGDERIAAFTRMNSEASAWEALT